jgi:hypothetical protein
VKFRHFTTLHTELSSEECSRRLFASIDPERWTIFSLSGYTGSASVIGWLDGDQFFLHKRSTWRNDFAPYCYGNFVTQDNGTIIECYFDLQRWTKVFMNFWLTFAILLGVPIFAFSVWDLLKTGRYNDGDEYLGLVVPVIMVLFGIYLPKFGLSLGESSEQFILEFLQKTLSAKNYEPSTNTST